LKDPTQTQNTEPKGFTAIRKVVQNFCFGWGEKIQHIEGEHAVQSLQVLISTNKRQAWLQRRKNTHTSFEEEDSKTTTQLW